MTEHSNDGFQNEWVQYTDVSHLQNKDFIDPKTYRKAQDSVSGYMAISIMQRLLNGDVSPQKAFDGLLNLMIDMEQRHHHQLKHAIENTQTRRIIIETKEPEETIRGIKKQIGMPYE